MSEGHVSKKESAFLPIVGIREDGSFTYLSLGEESDSESDTDSYIEVTAEELDDLENQGNENKSSVFGLASRFFGYFNPIKATHGEEEFVCCSLEKLDFQEETILVNSTIELNVKEEKKKCDGVEQIRKDGKKFHLRAVRKKTQTNENSDDSEVEFNFPDLDREEKYLERRPHFFKPRKSARYNSIFK